MNSRIKAFLLVGLLALISVSGSSNAGGFTIPVRQIGGDLDPMLDAGDTYLPFIQHTRPFNESQIVQRFAPVLNFDGSYAGLPMSAEAYFQNMLNVPGVSPIIAGSNITWAAERHPTWWGYGPFTASSGWDDPRYYPTIQTADVDGDGQAELLGRSSCGMDTWHLNPSIGAWYKIASCSPAWSDVGGWDQEKYYRTIQTADVDGDGRAELLGRAWCGMETWRFNALRGAWDNVTSCSPDWGDSGGWGAEQYYQTIQTADVDGDGQAELLGRSSCGMDTWRFNVASGTWSRIASCSPAWSDSGGWGAEQYYQTIQTADVDGDGRAELLGRAPCGMETWRFNVASGTWSRIGNCNPAWSDGGNWNQEKYYRTLQAADVDGDGRAELLGRAWCGMETWRFNASLGAWDNVINCSPDWGDNGGWGAEQYYQTIQTDDVDADGQAELLARSACGMNTWHFNASSNTWGSLTSCSPGFTDPWWSYPQYYSTIQTADVDGDGQAELLARNQFGAASYKYNSTFQWLQLSPLVRSYLSGRDDGEWGMNNEDFTTLTSGQVPTYYRVIYEASGRVRIAYWWYYGWQKYCNNLACISFSKDGAHHGDWEHILVTTTANREAVEYVTYYYHGNWHTRQWPNFTLIGEQPVVYVGKLGHGSYHSTDCSGWMAGTPSQCCEYADYRNPNPTTVWNTSQNLVNLESNSEAWMLADHTGGEYSYNGTRYTIYPWLWGPLHAYCVLCGAECNDWEHETACGTHPTVDPFVWTLQSCGGVGCGVYKFECPYDCTYHHNNPWPWD